MLLFSLVIVHYVQTLLLLVIKNGIERMCSYLYVSIHLYANQRLENSCSIAKKEKVTTAHLKYK